MKIVSLEEPGIANVASFTVILTFYTQLTTVANNYNTFVVDALIQAFIAAVIIFVVFLFKWIFKTSRASKRRNAKKMMLIFGDCVDKCCSLIENLGEKEGSEEDKEKGYKNTFELAKSLKNKVRKQKELEEALEGEPLVWRFRISFKETTLPILNLLEDSSDLIYWLSKSCKTLSYSPV